MIDSTANRPEAAGEEGQAAMTKTTSPESPDTPGQGLPTDAARALPTPGRLGLIAAAVAALLQFGLMARLVGPGLVSSYPGIEYDGFDWVLQGLYLRALAGGAAGPPLLFLRAPVFVAATALDAWLGSSGLAVIGLLCLAQFVSLTALLAIWKRLGAGGPERTLLFALALLAPHVYFRGFILADPLAIAAMLVSVRFMLDWLATGEEGRFRAAGAAGLLAGLTQLYGILPFLIGSALALFRDRRAGRSVWPRVSYCAAVCGCGGLILYAWNAAIPHEDVPSQLRLLRLDLDMAGFYANIWVWYFGFLAPLAVVLAWTALWRRRWELSPAGVYLGATTAVFVGLLFFYHSEEARFSWYYFPLTLCLAATGAVWLEGLALGRRGRAALVLGLALAVAQAATLSPGGDYWQPRAGEIEYDPAESLAGQLLDARPVDRLDLAEKCGAAGVYCPDAQMPEDAAPDERRLLGDYVRLRLGTR